MSRSFSVKSSLRQAGSTPIARWTLALACATLLSGCATLFVSAPEVGTSRDAVVQRMGPPQTERTLPSGTRLEYPGGPFGVNTFFVYLDAAQRVTHMEQVLTEANFARVQPDMPQSELLALLGRPGEVQKLGRDRGVVWSYRFDNRRCEWFQAEITADQKVRSASMGTPPECMGGNDPFVP